MTKLNLGNDDFAKGAYNALDDVDHRNMINTLINAHEATLLKYSLSKTQLRDMMATVAIMVSHDLH